MAQVYFGTWAKSDPYHQLQGRAAMLQEFEISEDALDGCEGLIAEYDAEGYEGSALVLLRKGTRLFTVEASHCSCYGLEGAWEPIETTKGALLKREFDGFPEIKRWVKRNFKP